MYKMRLFETSDPRKDGFINGVTYIEMNDSHTRTSWKIPPRDSIQFPTLYNVADYSTGVSL